MEFKNKKLLLIKSALQYGLLYSRSESESAEFAFLLLDVEREILTEPLYNLVKVWDKIIVHDVLETEIIDIKNGNVYFKDKNGIVSFCELTSINNEFKIISKN